MRAGRVILVALLLLSGGCRKKPQERAVSLREAIGRMSVTQMRSLIARGADVNEKDGYGWTPLHVVARMGHPGMAQLLLTHGADVTVKDIRGETPLHVAARNGYKELFNLLVTAGAEMSAEDQQGHTPIDHAQLAPAPQAVTLFADGKNPYAVIIVNPSIVREFLRRESILYDRVWTPGRQDIEGLDLKAAIEKSTHIDTKTWFDLDYILSHLSEYNREYAGFIKQGRRYVLCNMDLNVFDREPAGGFSWGADGGCSLARVVIDLVDKTVVRIDCNGN